MSLLKRGWHTRRCGEGLKGPNEEIRDRCYSLLHAPSREQEFRVIGHQLIRCASSVGANYRAASRARSKPDFIAKLGIVEEEADEVCYWLEILEGIGMTEAKEIDPLKSEANQLISIIIASKKTARANLAKASRPDR